MEIKEQVIKELQVIPGVGKAVAEDFYNLGVRKVADLKTKDPEKFYYDLEAYEGQPVDRCMLYVMRCAVYFAKTKNPDPEKLKWWNWKDK
jgi:hypothetical protein